MALLLMSKLARASFRLMGRVFFSKKEAKKGKRPRASRGSRVK